MGRVILIQGILSWGLPTGILASLFGWLFTDDSLWESARLYVPLFLVMGVLWGLGRWAWRSTARSGGEG